MNNKVLQIKRIVNILYTIPTIRLMITCGLGWNEIKILCEPLGLMDTAFRENPVVTDFLLDKNYWEQKLLKLLEECDGNYYF